MGKIDLGRVIMGGLLAGLVFNVLEAGASAFIYGADSRPGWRRSG